MKKDQTGITLVEALLVIAIGAMLIFFSIRQYQIYKVDNDVRQLQLNVDQFFQALSQFYSAQCYGTTRSDQTGFATTYGRLHPRITSSNTIAISPVTDLQTPGYITGNSFPLSPLVDTTGPAASDPYNGYILQFNRVNEVKRICTTACNASQPVTGINSANNCCDSTPPQTGTMVIWKPQVAVLMKDPATALIYLRLLGGDCLSSLSGATVTPCSGTGTGSGNYVVWQRQISYGSPDVNQDSMLLNPTVKQFTNMYRVEPITELAGRNHTSEFQYYVCGE